MASLVKSLALFIFLTTGAGSPGPAFAAGLSQDAPPIPEITPIDRFTPDIEPFRIVYEADGVALRSADARRLESLAARLRGTRDKISITAHAGDAQLSTHEAVKLSFKRALLIRILLLDEGVEPEQIELRALPQAKDGGPPDRVDIAPVSR